MTDTIGDDPFAAIIWGPTAWRVRRDAELSADTPITCPGLLVSRLAAGGQGRVLPGDPNNIRAGGYLDADQIGEIPTGGVFTVLSGPICADDMAWWWVDYDGLTGWTAEGQGKVYWLEPLP
jgi:hypothetical protein